MYLTVRRYEGVTDPSEVVRHVNEGFLPIVSQVQGFVAYYFVDSIQLPCYQTRPTSSR